MTAVPSNLLDHWHHIVFDRDMNALHKILAEDIDFYSPFFWKPKHGREEAFLLLSTVITVFEDFAYHRELVDGENLALEFSAKVGEFSIKGIDLIHVNEAGQFDRFEVFIRPANGLQALGMAMAQRLGGQP